MSCGVRGSQRHERLHLRRSYCVCGCVVCPDWVGIVARGYGDHMMLATVALIVGGIGFCCAVVAFVGQVLAVLDRERLERDLPRLR